MLQKLPDSLRKEVSKNLVEENLFLNPVIRKFLKKKRDQNEENKKMELYKRLHSSIHFMTTR